MAYQLVPTYTSILRSAVAPQDRNGRPRSTCLDAFGPVTIALLSLGHEIGLGSWLPNLVKECLAETNWYGILDTEDHV